MLGGMFPGVFPNIVPVLVEDEGRVGLGNPPGVFFDLRKDGFQAEQEG